MRITFAHPAVVTGSWENGHVRHELVRVPAEFDMTEFTDDEAPLACEVIDDASGDVMASYRTVDGRFYKAWRWDRPDTSFAFSVLAEAVYTGKNIDFEGLAAVLQKEIVRVAKITQYRNIENAQRKPLKREEAQGFSSQAVSCMKAPLFKRWQWLGPDADEEVAEWNAKTAAILSKIIYVEGVPHVLALEPCYRLTASATSRGNRSGPAIPGIANVSIFGADLEGKDIDAVTGMEKLSLQALSVGDQFFAANDLQGMRQFAEDSGWGVYEGPSQTIKVYDENAVFSDFTELETVRHAHILWDRANLMVGHVRESDGVESYAGRIVDKTPMVEAMKVLRNVILEWQETRNGLERLSAPFEDLLAEMTRWEEGRQKINSFDLLDQVKAFKVREDMVDVAVIPKPWSAPSP